jgi:hypothetical protein
MDISFLQINFRYAATPVGYFHELVMKQNVEKLKPHPTLLVPRKR